MTRDPGGTPDSSPFAQDSPDDVPFDDASFDGNVPHDGMTGAPDPTGAPLLADDDQEPSFLERMTDAQRKALFIAMSLMLAAVAVFSVVHGSSSPSTGRQTSAGEPAVPGNINEAAQAVQAAAAAVAGATSFAQQNADEPPDQRQARLARVFAAGAEFPAAETLTGGEVLPPGGTVTPVPLGASSNGPTVRGYGFTVTLGLTIGGLTDPTGQTRSVRGQSSYMVEVAKGPGGWRPVSVAVSAPGPAPG